MKLRVVCGLSVVAWVAFAPSAHADVFKCQVAGKTFYQDKPCPGQSATQQVLAIDKLPADKITEAQQRLETWRAEHDRREAVKQAAEQKYQQELMRQKKVEALQRMAKAQEKMARAAKQPIIVNPQPIFVPYGPGHHRFWHPYPHPPFNRPQDGFYHPSQEAPGPKSFAPATPRELNPRQEAQGPKSFAPATPRGLR